MQGYEPSMLYIRQSLQQKGRADRSEELREERGRGFCGKTDGNTRTGSRVRAVRRPGRTNKHNLRSLMYTSSPLLP
jgi:hypothetical protein